MRAVAARAAALLPALDGARFVEARAGLRPVSADGLPFVGPAADGIVLAGGHGREGIIHAPLCADGVARGVLADDWRRARRVPPAPDASMVEAATRARETHRLAASHARFTFD